MPFKNTTLAGFCSASRAYNVTVFSADPSGPKRGIRKKLSAKDRAKVHAVRRTGACLSCRMLKVPCDIPDPENPGPCKRCLAIASRPQQKGLLAFRECIRTKIRDVNIFQHTLDINYTSLQSPKLLSLVSKTVDRNGGVASLSLPDMLTSIFTWMVPGQGRNQEQSIVGALICSDQFRELVKDDGFLGGALLEKFRVMVYSSTLAYVYDSGSREIYDSDLTMRDLHRITYAMGSDLLLFLDNALVPHQLAKLSQQQMSGLFVVIFGIALAVAYSTAVYDSPTFDADTHTGGQTPRTLWQALQQHLSQMLAHHLVILGARLGLVLRGDSEKEVLSSLMSRIISRGNFVWVAQQRAVEPPTQPPMESTALAETTENTEELFVLNIPEDEAKSDPTTGALGIKKLDSYRSTPVSVKSLQTIQNTLRAIVPSDDDVDANMMSCANGASPDYRRPRSGQSFRAFACMSMPRVRRNSPSDTQHGSRDPTRNSANVITQGGTRTRDARRESVMSSSSGVSSVKTPTSSNALEISSTTATDSPSPFEPVSAGLDLDMDLDADPFGIGWLPDAEPESSDTEPPKLPDACTPEDAYIAYSCQRQYIGPLRTSSHNALPPTEPGTTTTTGVDDSNRPFTPPEGSAQSKGPSPTIWGVQQDTTAKTTPSNGGNSTPLAPTIWAAQLYSTQLPRPQPNTDTSTCTTRGLAEYPRSAQSTRSSQQARPPARRSVPPQPSDTGSGLLPTDSPGRSIWGLQRARAALERYKPRQPKDTNTSSNIGSSIWTSQKAMSPLPRQTPPPPSSQARTNPPRNNSGGTELPPYQVPFIWGCQDPQGYLPLPQQPNNSCPSPTTSSTSSSSTIGGGGTGNAAPRSIWATQAPMAHPPVPRGPPPPPSPYFTSAGTPSPNHVASPQAQAQAPFIWASQTPAESIMPRPSNDTSASASSSDPGRSTTGSLYGYGHRPSGSTNSSSSSSSKTTREDGADGEDDEDDATFDFYNVYNNNSYFGPVKKRPVI